MQLVRTRNDRFVEACQMLDYVEYLADLLIAAELEHRVKNRGNAEQGWPDCRFGGTAGQTEKGGRCL